MRVVKYTGIRGRVWFFIILVWLLPVIGGVPERVLAEHMQSAAGTGDTSVLEVSKEFNGETGNAQEENSVDTHEWMDLIMEQLHFEQMDPYSEGFLPEKMTFSDLVQKFCKEGVHGIRGREIAQWVFDLFFYELTAAKNYFIYILAFTVSFAIIKNILDNRQQYVSHMSFLLIYGTLVTLLMQSFLLIAQVAQEGIGQMIQYLTVLVPVYATTLAVSGNMVSAGTYYELSFLLMMLLEWLMRSLFVPGIHLYLLFKFLDQLFLEERFSRLADLIESGIRFVLRSGLAFVIGFGCIQSMLSPAQDRLSESVVVRSVSTLPGMGNLLGSTGDILLSCGLLIKNSVGVAALLILLFIWFLPVVKVFIFTFLYKCLAALLQPVADKKLINCIHSAGQAGELYLIMLRNSMLMFFLTVAMVTASTAFIF